MPSTIHFTSVCYLLGIRSAFVVIVIHFVDVSFNYFLQVCGGTRSAVEAVRQLGSVPTNAEEACHSHQLPSSD